jgi:hypothetical protein
MGKKKLSLNLIVVKVRFGRVGYRESGSIIKQSIQIL